MIDREKVVERLGRVSYYFKSLLAVGWQGDADTYREHRESVNMAIALLKEQEPKTVLHMAKRSVIPVKALSGFCPKCNHTLIYGMNKHFCGNCGQEVKWK